MLDNELFAAITTVLEPRLQAKFGPDYIIQSKNQIEQAGTPSTPTVFFEKLFDKRVGFVRHDTLIFEPYVNPYDPIPTNDVQLYETTIQFSGLAIQDPQTPDEPTASDLVNYVAMLLGADIIRLALRDMGANIERSTQVRNPYFTDDFERFEAHPSFDIVFQHQRELALDVPPISATELKIYPV